MNLDRVGGGGVFGGKIGIGCVRSAGAFVKQVCQAQIVLLLLFHRVRRWRCGIVSSRECSVLVKQVCIFRAGYAEVGCGLAFKRNDDGHFGSGHGKRVFAFAVARHAKRRISSSPGWQIFCVCLRDLISLVGRYGRGDGVPFVRLAQRGDRSVRRRGNRNGEALSFDGLGHESKLRTDRRADLLDQIDDRGLDAAQRVLIAAALSGAGLFRFCRERFGRRMFHGGGVDRDAAVFRLDRRVAENARGHVLNPDADSKVAAHGAARACAASGLRLHVGRRLGGEQNVAARGHDGCARNRRVTHDDMAVHDRDGNRDRNRYLAGGGGRVDVDVGNRAEADIAAGLNVAGHNHVDVRHGDGERERHIQRAEAGAGHRELDRARCVGGDKPSGDDGAGNLNVGVANLYIEEVEVGKKVLAVFDRADSEVQKRLGLRGISLQADAPSGVDGTADNDLRTRAAVEEAAGSAGVESEVVDHLRCGNIELHVVVGCFDNHVSARLNITEHVDVLRGHFQIRGYQLNE